MSDDDFLSRWSRRKRAVADEAPEPPKSEAAETQNAEPETEAEEEQLLAQLNLPVPETLKPGDDFSAFMADGVPAFLRKRALRVLWRSNPVLANLDGLNDYDEDFTSPELTQKVLATAYKVGRGFVTETKSETEVPEEAEDAAPLEEPIVQGEESPDITAENRTAASRVLDDEEPEPAVRPRRMRFKS